MLKKLIKKNIAWYVENIRKNNIVKYFEIKSVKNYKVWYVKKKDNILQHIIVFRK